MIHEKTEQDGKPSNVSPSNQQSCSWYLATFWLLKKFYFHHDGILGNLGELENIRKISKFHGIIA